VGAGAAFDPGICDAMFHQRRGHASASALAREASWRWSPCPALTSSTAIANVGTGVMAKITRRETGFAAQVITFVGIYLCISVRDPDMNDVLAVICGGEA